MRRLAYSLFCWLVVGQDLQAQVDQENYGSNNVFDSFNLRFDVQQEFTPSLSSLDSVELLFNAGLGDPSSPYQAHWP